jgi:hypothetical protein
MKQNHFKVDMFSRELSQIHYRHLGRPRVGKSSGYHKVTATYGTLAKKQGLSEYPFSQAGGK